MPTKLVFAETARLKLAELETRDPKKYAKVRKTFGLMEANLRDPGLHTHEFKALKGPNGAKVYEAYVENRTPSAYRIFWHYGPGRDVVTVVTITQHP